jgi:G8 domain
MGFVTIPATSELIFSDVAISIQSKGFNVLGAMRIGSPTCRLRSKITITLHGSRGAQSFPADPMVKGISVTGTIDVHGAQFSPTWTRLARTAAIGDSTLYVQDVVNWQVGQEIVITTTEVKDSRDFNRNSIVTITSIQRIANSDLSAIGFTPALTFKHYGGREYQAEVGLLSRNILIQGDSSNSEPTDLGPVCNDPTGGSTYPCVDKHITGFGAHIFMTGSTVAGRFSGVQVFRGGQTNVLGRYPIHFHMIGTVTPSRASVKDCSVKHSFFRAFAVHGTSGVLVTESVAFDVIGHAFFLEDGVEENNVFSYDFAAHVHPLGPVQNPSLFINTNGGGNFYGQQLSFIDEGPNIILPSDLGASGFYITNPSNTFLGCAASGGKSYLNVD